ncbi:MAG TPA: hypothetical protein VMM35_10620 [Longimicrobiales bacterium]|nr:hypothetical protein [Longimicrobiales bacterium]
MGRQRQTVAGIFRDEQAAASAVKRLIAERFDPESDINVVASHHHAREKIQTGLSFDVGRTATIGTAVGAVLAGVAAALLGVTSGFFTMENAGPVWAALEMAFIGGCFGFALGSLMSIDFARAGADFRRARIRGGVILVGVEAAGARADMARRILSEAGATHFVGEEAEGAGLAA